MQERRMFMPCVAMLSVLKYVAAVIKLKAGQNTQFSNFASTGPEPSGIALVFFRANPMAIHVNR